MKNIIFNRLVILGCCAAIFTCASAMHTFGQSNPTITTLPMRIIANQSVIPTSGTMLVRTPAGIFLTYNTAGLTPGTVATSWIAVFNTPAACATNPCGMPDFSNPATHSALINTGGKVVGADGTATYGGFRAVGDTFGIFGGTFAGGVIFPMTAEIHMVVRTHGVASTDPAVLTQQLTMLNGGCPPNTCANLHISIHQQ